MLKEMIFEQYVLFLS